MQNKVNLETIAREAGVSTVTVSRALNNKPDINKKTKQKILEVVQRLNYIPNQLARSLRTKQSKSLGIIVTDIGNSYYIPVIKGIENLAFSQGYSVVLATTKNECEHEKQAIKTLVEKRVDGLIITPVDESEEQAKTLIQTGIPFVAVARSFNYDTNFVIVDDFKCGFIATEYLISKGHHRILYLNGPNISQSSKKRLAGYQAAINKYGLVFDKALHQSTRNYELNSAYEEMIKIIESGIKFSAILCYNDVLAFGATKALNQKNFKIPQNVAVMGMDGVEFGECITPTLSTVKIPTEEMGRLACEVLLRKIKERNNDVEAEEESTLTTTGFEQLVLTPTLLIRNST